MFKKIFILLISLAIGSTAITQTAVQTDWSGGPGVSGPVTDWSSAFDMEDGVNWFSSSGELNLSYCSPVEYPVTGGYVRANYAEPVDIDNDGDMDILGAAGRYGPPYFFTGRIDWWENIDSTGSTWTHHNVEDNFASAPSISSADLDGDGDFDVIGAARGYVNHLAWWENTDGSGNNWIQHTIPSSLQDASSVYAADVDTDGDMDLLSTDASHNKVIWLKNIDGSGTNWTEYLIDNSFNNAVDVFSADIDGDGKMDAVGAAFNGDCISWWKNVDGSGTTWIEYVVSGDFNGARSVYAADVDMDGDTDILGAASLEWAITWWENTDGSGTQWIEHSIDSNFNYAFSVHASDIDDDGDNDVLGASYFADDITWWENTDGLGMNWHEHLIDDNFDGARDVSSADMDGDGDVDIIGAAQEAADISWWDATCLVGSGELVSSILDTETDAEWDSLIWTVEEPLGTSVYFQLRSSTDPEFMGVWSVNILTPGSLEGYLNDGDRYVQYKALFESVNPDLSPVLEDVTLSWKDLVGIDNTDGLTEPPAFHLFPNYPNPMLISTTISYELMNACKVELAIHNNLGHKIETLVGEHQQQGRHQLIWNIKDLPAGIYYYRLQVGEQQAIRKIVVLR